MKTTVYLALVGATLSLARGKTKASPAKTCSALYSKTDSTQCSFTTCYDDKTNQKNADFTINLGCAQWTGCLTEDSPTCSYKTCYPNSKEATSTTVELAKAAAKKVTGATPLKNAAAAAVYVAKKQTPKAVYIANKNAPGCAQWEQVNACENDVPAASGDPYTSCSYDICQNPSARNFPGCTVCTKNPWEQQCWDPKVPQNQCKWNAIECTSELCQGRSFLQALPVPPAAETSNPQLSIDDAYWSQGCTYTNMQNKRLEELTTTDQYHTLNAKNVAALSSAQKKAEEYNTAASTTPDKNKLQDAKDAIAEQKANIEANYGFRFKSGKADLLLKGELDVAVKTSEEAVRKFMNKASKVAIETNETGCIPDPAWTPDIEIKNPDLQECHGYWAQNNQPERKNLATTWRNKAEVALINPDNLQSWHKAKLQGCTRVVEAEAQRATDYHLLALAYKMAGASKSNASGSDHTTDMARIQVVSTMIRADHDKVEALRLSARPSGTAGAGVSTSSTAQYSKDGAAGPPKAPAAPGIGPAGVIALTGAAGALLGLVGLGWLHHLDAARVGTAAE